VASGWWLVASGQWLVGRSPARSAIARPRKAKLMGKSLSSDSGRPGSQKQQKEASRRAAPAAPDVRERIRTVKRLIIGLV
jgi:hypothetical protein